MPPKSVAAQNRNSIRVLCRFRPQNSIEKKHNGEECVKYGTSNQVVSVKSRASENDPKQFTFDRVFGPSTTQAEFFDESARPVVDEVFKGYNGTIFAYGQTSAGKTHTMQGPDLLDETNRGLTPRIIDAVFDHLEAADPALEFSLKISYVEIYMEKIRDLLNVSKANLPIHEDKTRGVFIGGVTEANVSSPDEIVQIMHQGSRNRMVASTKMNADSSRSHALFILTLTQVHTETGSRKQSRLYLVDLAGSEKVGKTGAAGQTLEEAKMINWSLAALGNVINALTDGKVAHIPYRDSKLTRVLQESLGGNSRTTLVICCSSSSYNAYETVSTLRFGERAKMIKNKAKVNQEKSIAEYKILLKAAHTEIDSLKRQLGGGVAPSSSTSTRSTTPTNDVIAMEAELQSVRQELANREADVTALREELVTAEAEADPAALDDALIALADLTEERDKLMEELEDAIHAGERYALDLEEARGEAELLREVNEAQAQAPVETAEVGVDVGVETDGSGEVDPPNPTPPDVTAVAVQVDPPVGTTVGSMTDQWVDPALTEAVAETSRLTSELDEARAEYGRLTSRLEDTERLHAEAETRLEADATQAANDAIDLRMKLEAAEMDKAKADLKFRQDVEIKETVIRQNETRIDRLVTKTEGLKATVDELRARIAADEVLQSDTEDEIPPEYVEELKDTISDLESKISTLESTLKIEQESVKALTERDALLTSTIETLRGEISDLHKKVEAGRIERTKLDAERHSLNWHLEKIRVSYSSRMAALDGRLKTSDGRAADLESEVDKLREAVRVGKDDRAELEAAMGRAAVQASEDIRTLKNDLKDRCHRVVELEMQLTEAREQHHAAMASGGHKGLHKRVLFLEKNIETLSTTNHALTMQNASLRFAAQVAERKLAARDSRVDRLEAMARDTEARFRELCKAKDAECSRLRGVVDTMRKELDVHRGQTGVGGFRVGQIGRDRSDSTGGRNIVRVIRGGSKFGNRRMPAASSVSPGSSRLRTPGDTPAERRAMLTGESPRLRRQMSEILDDSGSDTAASTISGDGRGGMGQTTPLLLGTSPSMVSVGSVNRNHQHHQSPSIEDLLSSEDSPGMAQVTPRSEPGTARGATPKSGRKSTLGTFFRSRK